MGHLRSAAYISMLLLVILAACAPNGAPAPTGLAPSIGEPAQPANTLAPAVPATLQPIALAGPEMKVGSVKNPSKHQLPK